MGVYEGRGQLSKALSVLQLRWRDASSIWQDAASARFEKKYIEPLEADIKAAAAAMDHIAALVSRARQDCR